MLELRNAKYDLALLVASEEQTEEELGPIYLCM